MTVQSEDLKYNGDCFQIIFPGNYVIQLWETEVNDLFDLLAKMIRDSEANKQLDETNPLLVAAMRRHEDMSMSLTRGFINLIPFSSSSNS